MSSSFIFLTVLCLVLIISSLVALVRYAKKKERRKALFSFIFMVATIIIYIIVMPSTLAHNLPVYF